MKKRILSYTLLAAIATSPVLACDQCGCQNEVYAEVKKNNNNLSEVEIVEVPTYKVVSVREKGSYDKISQLTPKVIEYVASKKEIEMVGAPMLICHEQSAEEAENAHKTATADVEVCVPVSGEAKDEDVFKVYDLEGGKMAKITHKGPYAECTKAYEKLFLWLTEKGYQPNGLSREVYLNDPREIDESEILTEIYVPIK